MITERNSLRAHSRGGMQHLHSSCSILLLSLVTGPGLRVSCLLSHRCTHIRLHAMISQLIASSSQTSNV